MFTDAVHTQVEFPLEGLQLQEGNAAGVQLYDCYAISNHISSAPGSTDSGHYTACVLVPGDTPQWYLFNDSRVDVMASPPGEVRRKHLGT